MAYWNFIRRSPLKKKPRQHRESAPWRAPKVRLSGPEMRNLRRSAFMRSAGRCENAPSDERCPKFISWWTGELAHMIDRGKGGSDSIDNVLFTCQRCHDDHTSNRQKLQPHKEWKL
jgi:5-methylcytosine-specific restriction endonuclease McrA